MPRHDCSASTLSLLFCVLTIGGCFEPDLSKVTVLCPGSSPCPAGTVCVDGICKSSVEDAATSSDGSATDLQSSDGMSASLCPQGGDVVFGNARGCPGTFASGMASKQCPSNWNLCTNATKVDLTSCRAAKSFFAAAVSGYQLGAPPQEMCGSAVGNQLLYGCGTMSRVSTAQCGGLPRVIDVMGKWTAPDGTLATAALTDPAQGVLCCPP